MTTDTLDTDPVPTDALTFSGGNLTATCGAGPSLSFSAIAQALEGKNSGKWFVEMTCVAVSGNVDGVGVVPSWNVHGGFIGDDATTGGSIGYFTNSHVAYQGNTQTSVNNTTWGAGDVIGIAIDLTNGKIWFNKNGSTSWVGTSGTPNPATNTNGFDISAMIANGRCWPAINFSGNGAKFTANFGASAFTTTVPSGFTGGWTNTTSGKYFGSMAGTGYQSSNTNIPANSGAGNMSVSKYTSTLTGSVTSVVVGMRLGASACKAVIYDATGASGGPGALLGTSGAVTTSAPGEASYTFSGVSVSNGTTYWIGLITSANDGAVDSPALTNGIGSIASNYAAPANPFGTPTYAAFRYPLEVNVNTAMTETATVTMHFGGIAISVHEVRKETATASLAFGPIKIVAAGQVIDVYTQVAMHFGKASIIVNGIDVTAEPTSVTFWTF